MKKGRDLYLFLGSCRTLHHKPNSSNANLVSNPIAATPFRETMQASDSDSSKRYSFNPTLHWNPELHNYFLKAYGADHFSRISSALTYVTSLLSIPILGFYFSMLNLILLLCILISQATFSILMYSRKFSSFNE